MNDPLFKDWKSGLNTYESGYRPEIWGQIENSLRKRKRRVVAWWLTGMLVFASVLAYSLIYFNGIQENIAPAQTLSSETQVSTTKIPKNDPQRPDQTNTPLSNDFSVHEQKRDFGQTISINEVIQPVIQATPEIPDAEESLPEIASDKTNLPPFYTFNPLPQNEPQPLHRYSLWETTDPCDWPDPIGCPTLDGKSALGKGRWGLSLTYGPGYAFRKIIAKDPEFKPLAESRNTVEHVRFDQTVMLELSYRFPRGITFSSGLHGGHLVEKLDFHRDSVIGSRTIIQIDTTYDPMGNPVITSDTLTEPVLGKIDKEVHTHFRTLSIPLMVGYEYRTERWGVSIHGGMLFNVLMQKKGEILSSSNATLQIPSIPPTYKYNWSSSFIARIGVAYRITDRLQMLVAPTLRIPLYPVTVDSYPLTQNYIQTNLHFGLKYEF